MVLNGAFLDTQSRVICSLHAGKLRSELPFLNVCVEEEETAVNWRDHLTANMTYLCVRRGQVILRETEWVEMYRSVQTDAI